jgi:hypothetical protein
MVTNRQSTTSVVGNGMDTQVNASVSARVKMRPDCDSMRVTGGPACRQAEWHRAAELAGAVVQRGTVVVSEAG